MSLPTPPISGGFGYPLGFGAAILVTLISVAAGATAHPQPALLALIVTSVVTAALTTLRAALATAAVCWALHTGFELDRGGDLVLNTASVRAAVLLTAAVLITFATAATVRSRSTSSREWTLQR